MAVREVMKMGRENLRRPSRALSAEEIRSDPVRQLVTDMMETMQALDGLGIAAPQVGENLRVVIVSTNPDNPRYENVPAFPPTVLFNPAIEVMDPATAGNWEGCLSVPGLTGYVERPQDILVRYLDEEARPREIRARGFLATVFQHEVDHLDGYLFVDRLTDIRTLRYIDQGPSGD